MGLLTDDRIHRRTDLSDLVSEIKQSDRESSENDCEMQPGQECPFIGEEYLGLYPDWYGNPLCVDSKRTANISQ
jgi:hypothetical protein